MATKEAGDLTGGGASSVSPLGELLTHSRELEEQLLKCQKENVTLRFEYEQATVELPRLQVCGRSQSCDILLSLPFFLKLLYMRKSEIIV